MSNYANLLVWQKADELAYKIYLITDTFPRKEIYSLTAQLRRAALSVPTNIVEGYNRKSKKELFRFLDIALGSLAETEFLFNFSRKLDYVKKDSEDALQIDRLIEEVGRLLWSFQHKLYSR